MVNERVAVALEDVAVGYRRGGDLTTVVRGIDATLECGRLVALLGRNGAGKSTLLRTLAAFQQPLAGKVCYGCNEQGHLSQQELAEKLGVSRQAVYKWECGQSYPEVPKLLEMKLLFGISIDELLDSAFGEALEECEY